MQDISSWEQSTIEARAAGSLGDRPLFVVSSETAVVSKYNSVWMELQTDLVRMSSRGRMIVDESGGDPIYQSPGTIVEAVRQVLGDLRQRIAVPK
jgi:hypothetical protein